MNLANVNYFKPEETKCKCGCGLDIRPQLRTRLNLLRSQVGIPLYVTSGARCPSHNQKVGGVHLSWHVEGLAADIRLPFAGHKKRELLERAIDLFPGIGIYDGFIHVDMRDDPKTFWVGK